VKGPYGSGSAAFGEKERRVSRTGSSAPHRIPHRTSNRICAGIKRLRLKRLAALQIAKILGVARSTVSAVLVRLGLNRLRALEPRKPVNSYERARPGELIHLDIKKLGRFQAIGKRFLPRWSATRTRGAGWDFIHVCVDDHSRVAYAEILPDQKGESCAGFLRRAVAWLQRRGVKVRRIMTDNAKAYTASWAWRDALQDLKIKRHITTRYYRPQTNGKAERFIQTLLREWAYARPYRSSNQRAKALPKWLRFYNEQRPHCALRDLTPRSRLRRDRGV